MKITKVSSLSGKTNTLDIPVTEEQLTKWRNGMLIQEAMPELTASQREFIMTGITEEEWDSYFDEEYQKKQASSDMREGFIY